MVETVVLSDPAHRHGRDFSRSCRSDYVTFWSDSNFAGLEATAACFKRHSFRPHSHDGLMIGLIDAGTKTFIRERTQFFAEPGSISVVNAGDLHTGSRANGDELKYRALYIPVSMFAELAGSSSLDLTPGFRPGVIHDEKLFLALGQAHTSIVQRDSQLTREHFLIKAVHALAGSYGSFWRPREKSIADAPRPVSAAYAILRSRFKEDLSISDIAAAVDLSPYHLMRLFRQHIGMPMHQFQTQLRINHGRELLQSGMLASEAALEVGFADQSHFSKRFKELVGASPVAYQRNMRQMSAGA